MFFEAPLSVLLFWSFLCPELGRFGVRESPSYVLWALGGPGPWAGPGFGACWEGSRAVPPQAGCSWRASCFCAESLGLWVPGVTLPGAAGMCAFLPVRHLTRELGPGPAF